MTARRRLGASLLATAMLAAGAAAAVPAPAHAQDGGAAAPAEPGQIDASKLSKVPKQKKFVEAEYPPEAAAKGIEAEVVLLLDIDEKGLVTGVGVAEPATPAGMGFDEAAMIAAQSWEFEPAEMDGKPIAVQITYRYRFIMKPKEPVVTEPGTGGTPGEPGTGGTGTGTGAGTTPPAAAAKKPVVNFSGRLLERGTRLPMAGVIVTVFRDDVQPPVGFEAATDGGGNFVFYDLAPAEWKVLVDAPGYFPYRTSETVVAGERTEVSYFVEKASYNPYDVTVTASRPKKEVSRTIISAEEIDKVPGGAGDPLSVVQNFAGVARTGTAAQLVVRGSAPEDTRVLVDGIEVPFIYHFGGLKSVLPIGVLESIEFYPGNFSPMYGRATGGIIDVRIKDLKPKKLGGYADVSILDTSVYLELPLGKNGGLALAGRRSYIDVLINAAVPDDAGIAFATAPRYYDYQLLGTYRVSPAHNLRLFIFGSDDRLAVLFANPATLDPEVEGNALSTTTTFQRGIFEHRYVPGTRFENSLRLAVGRDDVNFTAGQLTFQLGLTTFQLREMARFRLSDVVSLSVGGDIGYGLADGLVSLPRPPKEGQPQTGFDIGEIFTSDFENTLWSPGVFAEAEVTPIDGLLLLPGVRADYFGLSDEVVVQPRFTARWQVSDPVTLKGGIGLFAQEPTFEEVDPVFGNPDLGVERALHYSVGAEYKPISWLTLDATAFYKDLDNLISPTDRVVEENGTSRPLVYDNGATGQVVGLELQARHELAHNLTGWFAYTLSRAERTDSDADESRLFDFDQTHILTVVVNYLLPRNWQVGGRFRLVSGNPNTPVVGSVYDASEDEYKPIYGPVNSSRDGTFHQLDVRVDKSWIYEKWILAAYIDIQNSYNRNNPEGVDYNYDFSQSRTQTGVPIITIIGLRGEF